MAAHHENNFETHDAEPAVAGGANDAFLAMLHMQRDPDALAGETARAVGARLAADPALRAEAESLAVVDAMLRQHAARVGGPEISASMSDRALQASLRLMREQALLRRQHAARQHQRLFAAVPRWAWGTAVAAAIAVGLVLWAVNSDVSTPLADTNVVNNDGGGPPNRDNYIWSQLQNEADIKKEVDALALIASMDDMPEDDSTPAPSDALNGDSSPTID